MSIESTLVAKLARMNPELIRAAPARHMRFKSHPLERSTLTKMLPLHARPPPIVPTREVMEYWPGPSTILLFSEV